MKAECGNFSSFDEHRWRNGSQCQMYVTEYICVPEYRCSGGFRSLIHSRYDAGISQHCTYWGLGSDTVRVTP